MNTTGISVMSYLLSYCLMIIACILAIVFGVVGLGKTAVGTAGEVIKAI